MTSRSRPTFEEAFPNIAPWVNDGGMVEIGHDPDTDTSIRGSKLVRFWRRHSKIRG